MKLSDMRYYASLGNPKNVYNLSTEEIFENLHRQGIVFDNLYQELEMNTRYVDTHEDISHTSDVVSLHSHSFYEILYCKSGNVQYLLGSERYRLQRGDIVIVPPGVSHRPLFLEELVEPYHRFVIWVSTDFIEVARTLGADFSDCSRPHLLRTGGTQWEYLLDYFRRADQEYTNQSMNWQTCVFGCTLELFVHLERALTSQLDCIPIAEPKELLDEVLAYIEQNLSDKITLEQTARRFLVSSSTISQLFRNKMGVSFYRCVTQHRLIAAKTEILKGQPLEQIYQQVGFSDYSTFYRAFKREYGISPRQFRKLQGMEE